MRISKKTYYGLRAVASLAEHGELSAHELSKIESMPEEYLQKILQLLKRRGVVSSEKGARGGYTIARPVCDLSVWDVVSALDGGFRNFAPPRITKSSPYPKLTHCQTNQVWRTLEQKIRETLESITIDTIIRTRTR